jgi:GAF domain-containing protein/anti-sigma regulatory factor (Ser/Thr protein kinase)
VTESAGTQTRLAPDSTSPSLARRLVEGVMNEAGLQHLVDEALLLVTELVTNAVVHAGTEVGVDIDVDERGVRVEVFDAGPGHFLKDAPSETREGGRGVFLLDAIAQEWGTRHRLGGKAIWFRLGGEPRTGPDRPPRTSATARRDLGWLTGLPVDLEQRIPADRVVDELLRRVVEGLGLARGWVIAQQAEESDWSVQAAYDQVAPPATRQLRSGRVDGGEVLALYGARGVPFGYLALVGAALDDDGFALAQLVAGRISVVLRDERARVAQLSARGSTALLAEASEMFAGTLDVRLAVTLAAQLVVPRSAGWSAAWTTFERLPELVSTAHATESRLGELAAAFSGPEAAVLAARLARAPLSDRPLTLNAGDLPSSLGEDRIGGALVLPLVARRRLLGLLVLGRPSRPGSLGYSADEVGLLRDLARLAALAIDNARLYEERSRVAQALQSHLLPPVLPVADAVQFAARYAPAGEGNEVGGDFYDVFAIAEHSWGIAIGDVCGKGAPAAAVTGMARDVLRLLTRDGIDPDVALVRLNRTLLELGEGGRFCTGILGTVRPGDGGLIVRFSNAGHPPPVLVRATGGARFLGTTGTLLGVVDEVELVNEEVLLGAGDTLVFYTDGVTERRGATGMFGEEQLLAVLGRSAGLGASEMAGALEESLRRHSAASLAARDDLAVLVVRAL